MRAHARDGVDTTTMIMMMININNICTNKIINAVIDQCIKSGGIPSNRRWPDSPHPSGNLIKAKIPL